LKPPGVREGVTEVPPDELIFVGPGDFKAVGEEHLRYCIDLGALQPDHAVLDVGCGIGRMAIPLTRYLSEAGSYDGFDVVDFGIDWCRANISPRFPNFQFEHADVFNRSYNVLGGYEACEYSFPYAAERFDFAFAVSVFTHMLPDDVENYVYETARVLRPGGRSLSTFFLMNPEAEHLLSLRRSQLNFKYSSRRHRTVSALIPEDAVCHEESFIRGLYARYGLEVESPVRYGSWGGRPEFLTFQDVVIATKRHLANVAKPQLSRSRLLLLRARRLAFKALLAGVSNRHTWAAQRHVLARQGSKRA
jgi:SAM-dependent methyltransferase